MSFNAAINNRTPFAIKSLIMPDGEGQEVVLVIISATFAVAATGEVLLAEEQRPVALADTYRGVPGRSSTLREADTALEKPGVDVIVVATAYAPNGRPAERVHVGFAVGDVRKEVVVIGDRVWQLGRLGRTASSPRPFTAMPIVYERSFGGSISDAEGVLRRVEPRNPLGVGFHGARSADSAVETELPNVENPRALIARQSDQPEPAGMGAIGRGWVPRSRFAGTYSAQWLQSRWPFLPSDFDARYYQSAPLDQQSRTIAGGETMRTLNLTPEGLWTFRLPRLDVPLRHFYDDRVVESPLRIDTIQLEPDARTVVMIGRAAVRTVRNVGRLREIAAGHLTPGWLRARAARKLHISYRTGQQPASHFEV
jgi:hypothetical protein